MNPAFALCHSPIPFAYQCAKSAVSCARLSSAVYTCLLPACFLGSGQRTCENTCNLLNVRSCAYAYPWLYTTGHTKPYTLYIPQGLCLFFSLRRAKRTFQAAGRRRSLLVSICAYIYMYMRESQTVNTFLNKSFLPSLARVRSRDFVPVSGIILWFVHYPSSVGGAASKGNSSDHAMLRRARSPLLSLSARPFFFRSPAALLRDPPV